MGALLAFNRGIVSPLALARVDLKRLQLSAEIQTNMIPRAMGPMMFRPGFGYLGGVWNNAAAKFIEFVYSSSDTALVELTNLTMRVWIDDVVVRRPAVTSKFNRWNGAAFVASSDTASLFGDATDVGYWKDNDESGALSQANSGFLQLLGNGSASAIRDRSIAVVQVGTEHSLEIVVSRGSAILRVGTTEGAEDLLGDRTLRAGYHSISVTPSTSTMFVRLSNSRDFSTLVDSVTLGQAAADMTLPTSWTALGSVRWKGINDVIFVACDGVQQKRIERQGADSPRSWSIVEYAPEDGPFRDLNTGPVRLKVNVLSGDGTMTAERAYFKSTHVGALFSLASAGQQVSERFQAEDTFTDPIRVTGVGDSRAFTVELTGPTFTATTTVTLQRSVAEPGDWTDVDSYAATGTETFKDELDNQIIYYRIGIKTGDYTALDDITATLTFSAGSITGIVRVTSYTSTTEVSVAVLQALGRADQYTADWREGDWSPRRGYPSAIEEVSGRLMWFGKGMAWGSVSDQLDSFDDTVEGESAPIRRSLGEGAVDSVSWAMAVSNLFVGLEGAVKIVRSSVNDEPLSQVRFDIKALGDMGSAAVPAVRMDTSAVFVGANESKVYEIAPEAGTYSYGTPGDLTALVPEIGEGGFVRRAFQRYPDRRLHLVRGDGTVAVLVFDKLENVTAWIEVETDGAVEDVVVLPGAPGARQEDRVYYVVQRTIDGAGTRYLEKWATEAQAKGASDTRVADSFVTGSLSGIKTITDLDHLEGEEVVIWGNGKDLGTATVASGSVTASEAITGFWCVGLHYRGRYKSAKRALADTGAMLLTERKKINRLALVLAHTHAQGIKYGQSFEADEMDDLPLVELEADVDPDSIWESYDHEAFTFSGTWSTDPRLCLECNAPRPCTVVAAVLKEASE